MSVSLLLAAGSSRRRLVGSASTAPQCGPPRPLDSCAPPRSSRSSRTAPTVSRASAAASRQRGPRRSLPDTMTIRRLPQLWMSVTLLERIAGLAGLRRRSCARGHRVLLAHPALRAPPRAPPGFPEEMLMRGEPARTRLLDELRAGAGRHPRRPARQGGRRHAARPAHHPPGRRRQARRAPAAAPMRLRERRRAAASDLASRARSPAGHPRRSPVAHGRGARGMSGKRPLNPYLVLALAIVPRAPAMSPSASRNAASALPSSPCSSRCSPGTRPRRTTPSSAARRAACSSGPCRSRTPTGSRGMRYEQWRTARKLPPGKIVFTPVELSALSAPAKFCRHHKHRGDRRQMCGIVGLFIKDSRSSRGSAS